MSSLSPISSSSSPARPTAILVLGMHRSGTSVLTRLINFLGADLPGQLLPSNDGNETGYWESKELSEIHEQILGSLSLAWDQPSAVRKALTASVAAPYRQRILDILHRDFANSSLFVLKDPRLSLMVPFWMDLLAEFGADVSFVISIRNPLNVAASLAKRNQFTVQKSTLLWLGYLLEAELATRGLNRCFVSYEDILADWRGALQRITDTLGVRWPRDIKAIEPEADKLVSGTYCHYTASTEDVSNDPALNWWVKDAYSALLKASRGDDAELRPVLDRIRKVYDDADIMYGSIVTEHHGATWEAWNLRRYLATAQQNSEQMEKESVGLKQTLNGNQIEIARLTEINDQYKTATNRLQRELYEQKTDQERLLGELIGQRSEIDQLNSQLAIEAKLSQQRVAEASRIYQTELSEQSRNLARLQSEREQAIKESERLAHLHATAAEEVRALRNSASWRWTAPVRAIIDNVGRLRQRASQSTLPSGQKPDDAAVIRAANLFDEEYYRSQAVPLACNDALQDYLSRGVSQGWNPHWLFHDGYYLAANPEVAVEGINPVVHFLNGGWRQGLNPHPLFDVQFYLRAYPDVAAAGINPLLHFLTNGWKEGRNPNRLFDIQYYLCANPDVAAEKNNPVKHYILHGQFEGRNPSPLFDTAPYSRLNPECATLKIDPLSHYLWIGIHERRQFICPSKLAQPLVATG